MISNVCLGKRQIRKDSSQKKVVMTISALALETIVVQRLPLYGEQIVVGWILSMI